MTTKRFQRGGEEFDRRVGRYIAVTATVHLAQHVEGVDEELAHRGRAEVEGGEELRRVAAHLAMVLGDQRERVERLVVREAFGFRHAALEILPGQDLLDRSVGIVLGLARGDERLADLGVQAHLGVERLAVGRETLCVLILVAGEERADEPVVQIEDLIGERSARGQRDRDQRGVPAQRFEFLELIHGGLRAFAGHAQQSIGVDVAPEVRRQADVAQRLQAIEVGCDPCRAGFARRLAQPREHGDGAALVHIEQPVQRSLLCLVQRRAQELEDAALRAGVSLGAQALDGAPCRQRDVAAAHLVDQRLRQHHALRRLHGDGQQPLGQRAVRMQVERAQAEPSHDGNAVFAACLVARGIQGPGRHRCAQLCGDHGQQWRVWQLVARNWPSGKAQVGDLHGHAQAVVHAAMSPEEREIGVAEAVKAE